MVVASTGGRQGCKVGGIISNSTYEQALCKVRGSLQEANVVLVLKSSSSQPFWSSDDGTWDTADVDVVEVTFVDDEAAVVLAPSPKALDAEIECLLSAYVEAFSDYGLSINWNKGKSEALLAYRGRNASRYLDARRSPTGDICIKVPGCPGKSLHVVRPYKHLGVIIATKCCILPEALLRAFSAMAAYVLWQDFRG